MPPVGMWKLTETWAEQGGLWGQAVPGMARNGACSKASAHACPGGSTSFPTLVGG